MSTQMTVYDLEQQNRRGQTVSFVKFNMRAVTLQSQELKKLQSEHASLKSVSPKRGKAPSEAE